MYCNMRCIASWQSLNGWFCVVIQQLYCDKGCRVAEIVLQYGGLEGLFFVLQYTWCSVAKKGLGAEDCIAIQLLYCNLGRLQ